MDFLIIPGTEALGQPRLGSIYDETGTPASAYEAHGPYHCGDCLHKTKKDEPFCVHPKVVGDPDLQSQMVTIDGRPAVKIDMEHGCCRYVRYPVGYTEETCEAHGDE